MGRNTNVKLKINAIVLFKSYEVSISKTVLMHAFVDGEIR